MLHRLKPFPGNTDQRPHVPQCRRVLIHVCSGKRRTEVDRKPSDSQADNDHVPSCSRRHLGLLAATVLLSTLPRHPLASALETAPEPETEALMLPTTTATELNPTEKKILAINQRVQAQNNAPGDFPLFVRNGYSVKLLGDGYTIRGDGLIYKDYEDGVGVNPATGQEVTFHYTAYNESGARIDSTYNRGRPASTRIGIGGLIPGFEEGIKSMKIGGKRRIVVPPELGPPVGPSTFFSAKQFEVFDVELVDVKSCERKQSLIFSSVVCQ